MSIDRTTHLSAVPTVDALTASEAAAADTVAVYSRPGIDGTPTIVIEITDMRRNLMARSVIDTDAEREVAADFVLVDSLVERCGAWRIDPIHKHKRLVAMVTIRSSDELPEYARQRSNALSA